MSKSSMVNIDKNDRLHTECRFVFHKPVCREHLDDIHIVKELITTKDGKKIPNLRVVKNFKRPFWITKKHFQRHKQKKESEDLDKLNRYGSTQSDLYASIATRLGLVLRGPKLRKVVDSPYVYGTDVHSKTIIKKLYMDKFEGQTTPLEVCVLDIEEDTEKKEVIVISITIEGNTFTVIKNDFIKNKHDLDKRLKEAYKKYTPDTDLTKFMKLEHKLCNTEMEMVRAIFKKAHEWKPDIMEVWNIKYDVPRIVLICDESGVDPKHIFSDPYIPKEYRYFKWKEGLTKKVTESGKESPINPEEQWHFVDSPATFQWIDGMSLHRFVRAGGKAVPGGYSLDNMLNKELGEEFKKIKFKDNPKVANLKGIDWHKYMVKHYPELYVTYNQYDTTGPLQLDKKIKDICVSLPLLSNVSDFSIFNSGPKRIVDALHFFYLSNGKVLSAKPSRVVSDKILGLDGWIVTQPSERVKENGIDVIKEGEILNNIRAMTSDNDQVSGYPSNTIAANISRDTTSRELISVQGVLKDEFKKQNMNLLFGKINTIEYCNTMFKFPNTMDLMDSIANNIIKDRDKYNELVIKQANKFLKSNEYGV